MLSHCKGKIGSRGVMCKRSKPVHELLVIGLLIALFKPSLNEFEFESELNLSSWETKLAYYVLIFSLIH